MNVFLRTLLLSHVFLGLAGTVTAALTFFMIRNVAGSRGKRIFAAFLTAIFFLASWLAGGWYYVTYYGKSVKPVIKQGAYPWAHSLIMEFKEHVFLFLPFLSLVIFLAVWLIPQESLASDRLRRALLTVQLVVIFISVSMLFMGVLISGAVR